mmetsp:Transcript_11094/g.26124  ORF Transcript_11094/g.26124 Transcript_11094/m.26124 type:complete len:306 (+) Transcript_11094:201-1118(+)
MDLVPRLQPAEDADRVLRTGLIDQHLLESALEGLVLLDVLAILVDRRGADAAQLAAGQGGFEQVGRVHAALGRSGADDRVHLVDEQYDLPRVVLHLLEDVFEPLLELTAELGPGHQRAEVEADEAIVLEAVGDVAGQHPLGDALGDGRLAHPRVADQDGIVLGPPGQDLDGPADLVVAPDDRIQLALGRPGREVDAVLVQRRLRRLGDVLHLFGRVVSWRPSRRVGVQGRGDMLVLAVLVLVLRRGSWADDKLRLAMGNPTAARTCSSGMGDEGMTAGGRQQDTGGQSGVVRRGGDHDDADNDRL